MTSEAPLRRTGPLLRPCFPCRGADLVAARRCESVVFERRFGNTADQLAAEYDAFQASTSFGAVLREDGAAVGSVRLIRPDGERPVKTLADACRPPWSLSDRVIGRLTAGEAGETWDVATFAVDAAAAGPDRRVTMALLSVMFGAFRDNGVGGFVAMLDTRARRAFEEHGMLLHDLPGARPAPYLGSPCTVPVHRRLAEMHDEHAHRFPHLHEQVFHGRDIEGLDTGLSVPGSFGLLATV